MRLTQDQLDAAVGLLKQQKSQLSEYWSLYTDEQAAFDDGTSVVGTTWQVITNLVEADGRRQVKAVRAQGRLDRLVGHVDGLVQGQAPELHVHVDELHHLARQVNAQVAEWFGEAPANAKACAETANADHCKIFHADDDAYRPALAYWTTPTKECLDGSGDNCTDYQEWTKAWDEVKA